MALAAKGESVGGDERIGRGDLARPRLVGRAEQAAPRPHAEPAPLDADADVVRIPPLVGRNRRVEAEQVVAARVLDHAAHASGQVVGVEHREPAGLLGQVDERLLRVEQLPQPLAFRRRQRLRRC